MVEITWLGHATMQLRLESGEVFVLDPWIEGNPKYPEDPKVRPRGRHSDFARAFRSHPRRRAAGQEIFAQGGRHL